MILGCFLLPSTLVHVSGLVRMRGKVSFLLSALSSFLIVKSRVLMCAKVIMTVLASSCVVLELYFNIVSLNFFTSCDLIHGSVMLHLLLLKLESGFQFIYFAS